MVERRFLRSETERVARALGGDGVIDETTAPLLALAARLQDDARSPVPRPANVAGARMRLFEAVREQAGNQAAGSANAKMRGATLGAAAVAGAGLLIASAAGSANPVGIVRSTVAEFPAMVTGRAAVETRDVTLVGTVISFDNERGHLEIDAGGTRVAVDVRDVDRPSGEAGADGTTTLRVGAVVEVGGSVRDNDETTVRARDITVTAPTVTVHLSPSEGNAGSADVAVAAERPQTKPVESATDGTVSVRVGASATVEAPSLEADVNGTLDVAVDIRPTATPTTTASPTPTPTPTAAPTEKPRPTPTVTPDGDTSNDSLDVDVSDGDDDGGTVGISVD